MGKSKDLATGASAFYQDQTESDTRYVNVSGDTMTGGLTVDTSTTTNLTVDSANYGGIQFKAAGTKTGYITSFTGATESMYIGGADTVNIHTGTNHDLTGGTTRLGIDSSGRVTMPSQPSFMVIMTSAPTLTGTSVTTLPWNSEIFDVGNNFNTSTYTFTAPVSGKYYMHLHLEFHSDSSWTNSTWSYVGDWYVNGTQKTGADYWGHSGKYNICPNTAILNLAANDQVNVRARPNNNTLRYSGDSAGAFSNSKWMGYLIG